MQEFSSAEQKKLIWIVVAFCFSVVCLLGVIILAVLAIFFPLPYANVLKGVGLNNLALTVYQDVYENSHDVKDGYAYLMESIYAKYDKHIVFAYEMFQTDEQFSTFLTHIDNVNVEKYGISKNLITNLDEFDYVSGKYVSSLCSMGDYKTAFNFALSNLKSSVENFTNSQTKKSYLMFDYVASCKLKDNLLSVDDSAQLNMQTYASLCCDTATNFTSKSTYSAKEYALALECAVRNVEVYKSFGILSSFGVQTIISKDQIKADEQSADSLLASVLKKAVN